MKKTFLILILLFITNVHATTLKGGVLEEYIPKGFYGSWGVISKLQKSNNPTMFNFQSKDIWTLSGYGNILILENIESGAISEIKIQEKTTDGKTLKFEREKISRNNNYKLIYKEIVQFKLSGNNFSGTDDFIVEKYDNKNTLIEKNIANYRIEGVKISGDKPQ
jgi:hypothetical protein